MVRKSRACSSLIKQAPNNFAISLQASRNTKGNAAGPLRLLGKKAARKALKRAWIFLCTESPGSLEKKGNTPKRKGKSPKKNKGKNKETRNSKQKGTG